MHNRTLKEIEDEMDGYVKEGNIGKVMDLVDEHGNTFDAMYYAIGDGDVKCMKRIQKLGVDLNGDHAEDFLRHAVECNQLLSVSHLVKSGADIEKLIEIATGSHNDHILIWAKLWKQGSQKFKT